MRISRFYDLKIFLKILLPRNIYITYSDIILLESVLTQHVLCLNSMNDVSYCSFFLGFIHNCKMHNLKLCMACTRHI